jgi:CRISPR/Cas system endoribonuclease Cas6 (RAMP superfamily)
VRYGNATFIGGMGNCTFNIVNEDPYWMHLVNILSAFSFYCGTGVKTALGMGQTRRLGDSFYRGLNST